MSEYNNIFIDDKCSRFCNAPHRYSFNEGLVGTAVERVLMAGKLRSQGFGEIASPWLKITLLPELVHLY